MKNTALVPDSAKVQAVLAKYPDAGEEQLIPILQDVQESSGYLSQDAIASIGRHIDLPAIKVYGVATFYNQFRFQPLGRIHIQLCRGTACHVKGSRTILERLEKHLQVEAGVTTNDGLFSYEVLACIGACGLAPALIINGEMRGKINPDTIEDLLNEYRTKLEGV
jgi:NADH-quinone oxidoreductase subunit E